MQLFQIILLFVVAELSCLRHPVVYGEGNLEISSQNTDLQTLRTKRWLWPGKDYFLAFKLPRFQMYVLNIAQRRYCHSDKQDMNFPQLTRTCSLYSVEIIRSHNVGNL